MHYTLKDHQGSLTATICGNTVERLSYDAWGRRRNPVGFGYDNVAHTFDRGYTLHEHYDDFGLINMNGRCYDPVIGRMLSPDVAIQDEHNMQAYNRYSYCFNNPLRFTDPSGYVVTMPFEYYGFDSWDYGYCGFSYSQGSAFNTEDTEGKPRLDEDWFENEETGAIYYNSNMHKGDEGTGRMTGSGWKWLGENGMFSSGNIGFDVHLVAKYCGNVSIDESGNTELELMVGNKTAKGLMASVGYQQVNTQVIVYSNTYTESWFDGKHSFCFDYGVSMSYGEKVGYVPKGYTESDRSQLGRTLYGPMNVVTGAFPEVSRFSIQYDNPSGWKRLGRFLKVINGHHDYIEYYDGGTIESYLQSGAKNTLINDFLQRYPKY